MMPEKQSALPNEAQPRVTRTLMTLALCYALGVVWRALEWGAGRTFCIVLAAILTLAAWLGGRRRLAACFAARYCWAGGRVLRAASGYAGLFATRREGAGARRGAGGTTGWGYAPPDAGPYRAGKGEPGAGGKAAVTSYTQPAFTLACGRPLPCALRSNPCAARPIRRVDYTLPNKADGIFFTMRGEAFHWYSRPIPIRRPSGPKPAGLCNRPDRAGV